MNLRALTVQIGTAAILAALPVLARAETRVVAADDVRPLQAVIDAARPGDVITLQAGEYKGPITIDKALSLVGQGQASVIGNGKGSVITIVAEGVTVRGLQVSGSGTDLAKLDSGVFAAKTAKRAVIEDNTITGNLIGVYLHGAPESVVRRNRIAGLKEGRLSEAGNGVTVWNAPGSMVLDNDISFGRDGISTNASKRNVFSGNRFSNLRFAIHYMYTNDSEISNNVSTGNAVGYAVMFSNRLKIKGNRSDGDRDHGLLLNYANGSEITGNVVVGRLQPAERWLTAGTRSDEHGTPKIEEGSSVADGNRRLGPEKCVFIYNANKNRFRDNIFEGCAIGIHFTAGSEGNNISRNAFINNRNQVKYVGTRHLDWSSDGRGNYWSDNPAFDLNGDGIGDSSYRPNDLIDRVLWTSPQAKLLTSSPAVQVIRWAQAQFPALLPGGVIDSHPLMLSPERKEAQQ
ncbi:nitrous oxide reductase family maturation protein NosD [Sinorhizobium mexicanum]|uniref:Nitrous oxide reductase family maturation protein NosD n=1 Tax=Sinorhizobium mexicanum TaxID=375549 RepID=A0A859QPK2_9HYPH|nr:nitrous oxide reductase family maturation protein NosD [Sinorhizobium mexicanum]MBP1886041.1 nitrous oxidase accessory protein [Sinorhizobium mexicanum]QLL65335.1 nitrous oxide reductase family maturation protein NosD [Sinorhizobium mexicanum]